MVNNCTLALKLDAESSKALYRRAYARFAKKDYDNAKIDLDKAEACAPGDKAVATLLKKVRPTFFFFSVVSYLVSSTVLYLIYSAE